MLEISVGQPTKRYNIYKFAVYLKFTLPTIESLPTPRNKDH